MKQPCVLIFLCCLFAFPLEAQLLQKIREKTEQASDKIKRSLHKRDAVAVEAEDSALLSSRRSAVSPHFELVGDPAVQIDSAYRFEVAIYQQSEVYQGQQRLLQGGDDLEVRYSKVEPTMYVGIRSHRTGLQYAFYADFRRDAQAAITEINGSRAGEKKKLELENFEPIYPGESGYLNRLLRTGNKKVILGIACEEYAGNNMQSEKTVNSSRQLVKASVWIPLDPTTVFPGYSALPAKYKQQVETLRRQEAYPLMIWPLEIRLDYSNGDHIHTVTTRIQPDEQRTMELFRQSGN